MNKSFIFVIIMLTAVITSHLYFINISNGFNQRIELNAKDNNCTTLAVYSNIKKLPFENVAFLKEISAVDGLMNIKITNSSYVIFKDFELTRGSFYSKQASDVGINVAVISEQLSFKLFKTLDSIGNTFKISGINYTVCGVYKKNSIYDFFTSNGMEDVYIPSRSGFDAEYANQKGLQTIFILYSSNSAFAEQEILSALRDSAVDVNQYFFNDFRSYIITQYIKIPLFIAGIAVIALIIRIVYIIFKKALAEVKPIFVKLSFGDAFSQCALHLFYRIIICFALIVSAVIVYDLCSFSLYIPANMFPSESLFDFNFYKQLVSNKIELSNYYYFYKKSSYEIFYGLNNVLGMLLCLCEIVLIIIVYRYFVSLIKKYQLAIL